MTTITKENLIKRKNSTYTVGQLLKYIKEHNVSEDAIILVEKVDDEYFNGGIDISGMRGVNGILPEGSRANEWEVLLKTRDGIPTYYAPIWSPIKYDDKEFLFLDLHY